MVGYYLFIGGPWDGEKHRVDGRSHWIVPVRRPSPPPTLRPIVGEVPFMEVLEHVTYTLRSWNIGRWFNVYADETLTDEMVMFHLMHRYQKGSR